MKKIVSLILCIILTITLCSCSGGLKRYEKSFLDVFDTASNVVAYDTDSASFEAHYNEMHADLVKLNDLFDIYESHEGVTSLKDVNAKAALSPVKVDPELFELLKFGKEVYRKTNGTVNICMGAVLAIWHDYREEGKRIPDMKILKEASKHCDIDDMVLDSDNRTVFLNDSEMSIDVGAIAKGYAAQKVIENAAARYGWSSMLINLGGNVATSGAKPDGSEWNVQIENPRGGEAIDTLAVMGTSSVVTSGDYQRYYEVDGKRYCHIIDPDTLMPADRYSSVTVACPDPALADALSTALFILPYEDGKKLINSIGGASAVWVDKNNQIVSSV